MAGICTSCHDVCEHNDQCSDPRCPMAADRGKNMKYLAAALIGAGMLASFTVGDAHAEIRTAICAIAAFGASLASLIDGWTNGYDLGIKHGRSK